MTRLTTFATLLMMLAPISAVAQTMTEWKDMDVNSINRMESHTPLFPFESVDAATRDMTASSRFLSIDGTWRFLWTANADDVLPADFFLPAFDDSRWGTMPVPGLWELQKNPDGKLTAQRRQSDAYGVPVYVNSGFAWNGQYKNNAPLPPVEKNHVGLYRRSVSIPADWQGEQMILHLGSVTSCVYVWVNGKFVGYSEDSKVAAEFDVTPYLTVGNNTIALKVYRWCDGSYCEDQDAWRLTGIARQSYIYSQPKATHVDDLRVTADMHGQLTVCATVTGKAEIAYTLTDRDGRTVAEASASGTGELTTQMTIDNPHLWSAEQPYLYRLTAVVAPLRPAGTSPRGEGRLAKKHRSSANTQHPSPNTQSPTTLEVLTQRVGFRSVEMSNGQMLVNGKAILIKGVDRHEIDPEGGYNLPLERMISDIRTLKAFNINAVRTCHYPNDPRWYDLCDEYGIYLCAEANIESHGYGFYEHHDKPQPPYTPLFAKQILERNQHNVKTFRNHPAIITWSLGNETVDGPNFTAAFQWIKSVDASRPIQWHPTGEGDNTEIFCPMYMSQKDAVKYSADNTKQKPLIQCEYSHAMGNSSGGFREYWDAIRHYPRYQGGYIWDFADQALRVPGDDLRYRYGGDFDATDPSDNNFNCNGIFSPERVPSPQAYEVRYQHQNVWTSWGTDNGSKPQEQGSMTKPQHNSICIYNENFFRPLDYVTLHWQLLCNGTVVDEGDKDISELNIQPQQKGYVTLPYTLPATTQGEMLLSLSYRLKAAEPLLPAGHEIAYDQLTVTPFDFAAEADNVRNIVTTGLAQKSAKDKKAPADDTLFQLLTTSLRPNFWRAPTDNDMGADLPNKYKVWKNPVLTLVSEKTTRERSPLNKKAKLVILTRVYDMPDVDATLTVTFVKYPYGAVEVTQTFEPKGSATDAEGKAKRYPNMFRYGMMLTLPHDYQNISYYGRGPWENYSDRNSGAMLGLYKQTVDEQFYPYIRPQATGTKTDVRMLGISSAENSLLISQMGTPFSFSVLNYTQDELDETTYNAGKPDSKNIWREKNQRHPADLRKSDHVTLCLDLIEAGVGGINSWSGNAEALPQYRVPYGKHSLTLLFNK